MGTQNVKSPILWPRIKTCCDLDLIMSFQRNNSDRKTRNWAWILLRGSILLPHHREPQGRTLSGSEMDPLQISSVSTWGLPPGHMAFKGAGWSTAVWRGNAPGERSSDLPPPSTSKDSPFVGLVLRSWTGAMFSTKLNIVVKPLYTWAF